MDRRLFIRPALRPIRSIATLLGLTFVLHACTTPLWESGNQYQLTKDIVNLEGKVDKMLELQTSSDHKVLSQLGNIDTNLERRNDVTQNAIQDMEERLRSIEEEMDNIQAQLEVLTVQLNTLSNTLGLRQQIGMGTDETPGTAPLGPGTETPDPPTTEPDTEPENISTGFDQAFQNAMHQYNLGEYQKALDLFKRLRELNPSTENLVKLLFWMGNASFELGDYESALFSYVELIRTDSKSPKAWEGLEKMANIHYREGDLMKALKLLNLFFYQDEDHTGNENYPHIDRVRELRAQIEKELASSAKESPSIETPAGP